MPDGSVQLERKTYPQAWRSYSAAQTSEKEHFLNLLKELCDGIEVAPQTRGRPRIPLNDALFSVCYKIYSGKSARRFIGELAEVQQRGFIAKVPHFNSMFNYLDSDLVTEILTRMIEKTSLPLKAVEVDFAADSSGFTSNQYSRWYDHKYGGKHQHFWTKVHMMIGVETHIVTAVEIHDKDASDTKQLPALVATTAKNFSISEVSADKGYSSTNNHQVIAFHGATPYIAFRSIHSGKGGRNGKPKCDIWQKMYHQFACHSDEFYAHYHKRSNVESAFSMIKRKFGSSTRGKSVRSMKNECLAKIVCHNICVLIQEMHELGIDVSFGRR
jgi:transposase